MAWLGLSYGSSEQAARFEAAVLTNAAAQEGVQQASEDAVASAHQARRRAVFTRRQTQLSSRRMRSTSMQTGTVRDLVDQMLNGPPEHEEDAGR